MKVCLVGYQTQSQGFGLGKDKSVDKIQIHANLLKFVISLHSANFDILYLDEFCLDLNLANRSVLSQPKVKFNYFMSAQLSPRVQEIAKPREIECRATTGLAVDESMPYGVSKPRIWVRQGQIF